MNSLNVSKSLALLPKVESIIPYASQTFSKGYRYFPLGVSPIFFQKARGSLVEDVDGNRYIDWVCGLGPITLGWNNHTVNHAIEAQLKDGITFSLPHPLEYEVAKELTEIIPSAEMVRFCKTGSEATQAAIRAARAVTGRYHIAFWGYHGWHEWYACSTERNGGIPPEYAQYMHPFQYNNLKSLENILNKHECAAVIMEPMTTTEPDALFLSGVQDMARHYGAVLIFDEMVTGFRWDLGGAQRLFNITPDMSTFGKGIANGMPLACVVGSKKYMSAFNDVFFSGTFSGECLSLAAALATIRVMRTKPVNHHIWDIGNRLREQLEDGNFETSGYSCRFAITTKFTEEEKALFLQEVFRHGVFVHSSLVLNTSFAHSVSDADYSASVMVRALNVVEGARRKGTVKDLLQGQVTQSAFRRL
ncbi:MAG: aminotransferase class III-fold pyridoxal phosphate-dependent enzyme [Dehalococcoidia bacterium]|nr:aminotransferase class III-fold pyridoxal phosphate-dependent enzyme [Dehalococcoidia bacterium]